jgi:hypothetical protein
VESASTISMPVGPETESPGPFDRLADHGFELADMAEGERPRERAQR